MRLNKKIFHEFFYSKNRGLGTINGVRGKANVSYRGNSFFSYNTEIGHIVTNNGVDYLLVSFDSLTRTTASHLYALRRACPFIDENMLQVPYDFDDYFADEKAIIREMLRRIERYIRENVDKLSREENRTRMERYIRTYIRLKKKIPKKVVTRIITARKAIHTANKKLEIRREKAAERAAMLAKEKAIRAEKIINEYCPNWSLLRKVKACFTNYFADYSADVHNALYDWLFNAYPLHSFVWYDEEKQVIRTSQCVTMSPNTAARAYKAFKAGKIQAGMHLGPYEIREITPRIRSNRLPQNPDGKHRTVGRRSTLELTEKENPPL